MASFQMVNMEKQFKYRTVLNYNKAVERYIKAVKMKSHCLGQASTACFSNPLAADVNL
jgi:hypothetical protein